MKTILPKALGLFLVFTVICGVLYTLIITGIGQLIFPQQAQGSLIKANGKVYGSSLIGQSFSGKTHLWGRPVNIDVSTYKDENGNQLAYGAPSNLSPASADYKKLIASRVAEIKKAHPEKENTPVPVELVTGSGSGLDPHISPAAAKYQVSRVALANNLQPQEVEQIIKSCTSGKFLGIFGSETVNVLKVNLMLEGILN